MKIIIKDIEATLNNSCTDVPWDSEEPWMVDAVAVLVGHKYPASANIDIVMHLMVIHTRDLGSKGISVSPRRR